MMAKQAGVWDTIKDYGSRIGSGMRSIGQRIGSGMLSWWNRTPINKGIQMANSADAAYYGDKKLGIADQMGRGVGYGTRALGGALNALGHTIGEGAQAVGDFGGRLYSDVRNGQGWNSVPNAYNYAKAGVTAYDPVYDGQNWKHISGTCVGSNRFWRLGRT